VIDENREYFLATRDYARANRDVIKTLMQDLSETEAYAAGHHAEVVSLLAPEMRMDKAAVQRAIDRLPFGVSPVTAANFASQQDIADLFASLHLIPRKIDVGQAKI
jgi:sulfonate transport system substrate-binding protein